MDCCKDLECLECAELASEVKACHLRQGQLERQVHDLKVKLDEQSKMARTFLTAACTAEGERDEARDACRWALDEWFDRVYPPDIFVGGPKSDPGVNEVREVANRLRTALGEGEGEE